jgi:hypothetical protein
MLLCHFGTPGTLVRAKKSRKSFISPTSRKSSRNPFVSPTYAETGGWGGTFELSTFNFEPLFSPNPNHSRTYAKQGGGGRVS